jgi:hypothetical protein
VLLSIPCSSKCCIACSTTRHLHGRYFLMENHHQLSLPLGSPSDPLEPGMTCCCGTGRVGQCLSGANGRDADSVGTGSVANALEVLISCAVQCSCATNAPLWPANCFVPKACGCSCAVDGSCWWANCFARCAGEGTVDTPSAFVGCSACAHPSSVFILPIPLQRSLNRPDEALLSRRGCLPSGGKVRARLRESAKNS